MLRRALASFAAILALSLLVWLWRAPVPLTLTIGSGSPSLVQASAVVLPTQPGSGTFPYALTLAAPSVAGDLILGVFYTVGSPVVVTAPAGWSKLASATQGANDVVEVWAYPNNPGAIQVATFTVNATAAGEIGFLSEWKNVVSASIVDASGTATATSGTTLALSTTTAVTGSNELAVAVWVQQISVAAAVTFTSPSGWTRLIDNGSASVAAVHVDSEYLVGPAQAATLTAVMSSDHTTTSAAGIILALKAGNPAVDMTAYIRY
jgi:hypothetical protein